MNAFLKLQQIRYLLCGRERKCLKTPEQITNICLSFYYYFSIWRPYQTPFYQFRPLHKHVEISRAVTAESSPLHIASDWNRTGNPCFLSARHYALSYAKLLFIFTSFCLQCIKEMQLQKKRL